MSEYKQCCLCGKSGHSANKCPWNFRQVSYTLLRLLLARYK